MPRNLPSIGALQSFEATARHLSFTRAAMELNVTQTAVSHRMKELETLLGVQLFARYHNRIRLTDEGRNYLQLIRPALAEISVATDRVTDRRRAPRLRLLCLTTFLIRRLMPKLKDFQNAHPDVELHLTPMNNTETLNRNDFDIAIWYGSGDWPGFEVQRLGTTEIFPVCSPKLLKAPPLKKPADIYRHTIIRSFSPLIMDDWPAWLDRAGLSNDDFASELRCDGSFLSIEAAISGLGIFIGRSEMVESAIRRGLLVEPFKIRLESESSYYMLIPSERSARASVKAFRSWLLADPAR